MRINLTGFRKALRMVECLEIEENKRLRVIVIRNNEEIITWDYSLK